MNMADAQPIQDPIGASQSEAMEQPVTADASAGSQTPDDIRLYPSVADVKAAQFTPLTPAGSAGAKSSLELILDVLMQLSVELGRAKVQVRDVLDLGPGSVLELDKLAGEPVEIMVNGKLIARGDVVVIDENFGVRVTEIISPAERIKSL
jgi:flagellar motor switch protein FliN/FliY